VLKRFVVQLVGACIRFPKTTVLIGLVLAVLAGAYTARHFAINTDISQMIDPDLDWRQREIGYDKAFPGSYDMIIAVVDAPTAEYTKLATDALEQRLHRDERFLSIQNLAGSEFFERNGLLFLSTEEVGKTADQLAKSEPLIGSVSTDPSLRGLTDALASVLAGIKRGEVKIDDLNKPLTYISDSVEHMTKTGKGTFSWRQLINGEPLPPSQLRSFLRIKPVLDYKALEPGQAATDAIRAAARELHLAEQYGARVRLTGPVPISNEEFGSVKDGAVVNAVATVVIVLFILWLALHSPKIIVAVFITLSIGLSITTALGLVMVNAFNPISVAFAVLFVGLGVDFGIQYSVRYRAERFEADDLEAALIKAGEYSAVPLSLAAIATACGFLSFLPTSYKGVSELGKIAGVGMMVAFVGSITVLPALLRIFNPPGEKAELGFAALAPIDSFMERHRIPIVVTTLALALLGTPLLYFLHFDFNPINLRNPHSESIATYLDLRRDPNSDTNTVDVVTPSEDVARRVAARLEKVPEVARVRFVDSFIPTDQDAKLAAIRAAANKLEPTLSEARIEAPTDSDNIEALKTTADLMNGVVAANKPGPGASAIERLSHLMLALADSNEATRSKVQDMFVVPLQVMLQQISGSLKAQPVTLKDLPPDLLRDWVNPEGQYHVQASPKGDPNDNDTLRKFAAAVQAAEPTAINGPISILEAGRTISFAFIEAGGWALISIALLLWLVLRRFSDVLMTLVPLILAGVVTMEICVLIGLQLNFANIVALPLLLGVGVAFKIYYVTAWRAGQTNLLQSSLTRAVFFSAMTTATAFGSLWLSSHPGTASMGKLLALSLVTTLAAAVLFQPLLMGRPRSVDGGGS
jgi:hopanoid biosynthesis associated RND transporter like protein HpnN